MSVISQSAKYRAITPKLADDILTKYVYDRQRPLRQDQIDRLTIAMRDGKFTGNQIAIVFWNGNGYICNGQHTLWAVMQYGEPLTLLYSEQEVSTEAELNRIYSNFDIGIVRNVRDTIRAFGIADSLDLNGMAITNLTAAVRFINAGFQVPRASYDKEALVMGLPEWTPELRRFSEAVNDSDIHRRLRKRDSLAVALVTFRFQRQKAADFWGGLAKDDRLASTDARKVLRKWFFNQSMLGAGKTETWAGAEHASRTIALAWNKFFTDPDAPVQLLKVTDHRAPIKLLGTPYGKNVA